MNTKAKMNVLQELIEMMKQKEAEEFKGKSSKFMAKPEMEIEVSEEPMDEDEEDTEEEDSSMPEEQSEMSSESPEEDEDDVEKLKALYARLK